MRIAYPCFSQLGPFLELRELAADRSRASRLRADDARLGPRVRSEASRELEEWEGRAQSANEATQHLYQEYYRRTVELVTGQALLGQRARRDVHLPVTFHNPGVARQGVPWLSQGDVIQWRERHLVWGAAEEMLVAGK